MRIIPHLDGNEKIIEYYDRLDVISQNGYNDPTKFWHIADANTALYAKDLIEIEKNKKKIIKIPVI